MGFAAIIESSALCFRAEDLQECENVIADALRRRTRMTPNEESPDKV